MKLCKTTDTCLDGQRLSAVARRRFLRDGFSTASAGSTPEATSPALPTGIGLNGEAFPQQSRRGETNSPSENGVEIANQFSTLVQASAVAFSPSREVEELTRGTVRIRLSRGQVCSQCQLGLVRTDWTQKCVLLGTCTLWVKQGSVSVYGAVLSASTAIYRIYAPTTHALPAIEATTTNAEVEIEPLSDGITELPYTRTRDRWTPVGVKQTSDLFCVLGHSIEYDLKSPGRLRELDIAPWKALLTNASTYDSSSPPRILICGRRSSGLSTFARCIVNRLLARQSANSDLANRTGVRVVDLDLSTPEFVPPGLISLVQVNEPVFGPPFTHLLPPSSSDAGHVLRTHFLGEIGATDLSDWHLDRAYDLFELETNRRLQQHRAPLVILLPRWLNEVDDVTAIKLWSKMAPTQVFCLDPNPALPHLTRWQSIAEDRRCNINQVPVQVFEKISAVQQHDLQMQSYFHLNASPMIRPFWDQKPILAGMRRHATLSYGGDDASICLIFVMGGHIAFEDTYEALWGSLVALVAVPSTLLTDDVLCAERTRHNLSIQQIQRTDEDLPRWQGRPGLEDSFPFAAEGSFCLGLALVQDIDVASREIRLITGPELHAPDVQSQGYRVAVFIPKATADGRFRTDWVEREMQMRKGGNHTD